MPAPTTTQNTAGNIASAVALAAGASSSVYTLDNSTRFGCVLLISVTYGATVAATAGVRVDIYGNLAGSASTDPFTSIYPAVGTATTTKSALVCALPEGKWFVKVTNLDVTNGITSFSLTTDTTDTVV